MLLGVVFKKDFDEFKGTGEAAFRDIHMEGRHLWCGQIWTQHRIADRSLGKFITDALVSWRCGSRGAKGAESETCITTRSSARYTIRSWTAYGAQCERCTPTRSSCMAYDNGQVHFRLIILSWLVWFDALMGTCRPPRSVSVCVTVWVIVCTVAARRATSY